MSRFFITRESRVEYYWKDTFEFIEFFPDKSRKAVTICRRKFLKNISKLKEITELHILFLKHITELKSIIHYPEDTELILTLSYDPCDSIHVEAKPEEFYELIQESIKN